MIITWFKDSKLLGPERSYLSKIPNVANTLPYHIYNELQ